MRRPSLPCSASPGCPGGRGLRCPVWVPLPARRVWLALPCLGVAPLGWLLWHILLLCHPNPALAPTPPYAAPGVAWNINLYICRAETPNEGLYYDAIYDCYTLCASTVSFMLCCVVLWQTGTASSGAGPRLWQATTSGALACGAVSTNRLPTHPPTHPIRFVWNPGCSPA